MEKIKLIYPFLAGIFLTPVVASGQTTPSNSVVTTDLISVSTAVRADWQHETVGVHTDDANSGFEGKYFLLRVEGEIIPGLTYAWRQRMNKATFDGRFFDSTDWLYVAYAYDGWRFSGGKEVVAVGGFEYDRNPVGLYSTSLFWQNISCFQFGAGVGYMLGKSDQLTFQVAQSPFFTSDRRNMYAWSVLWIGDHGWYKSLWSANMMEYLPDKYISYLALGNRFELGNFVLELDLMNRAAARQRFLFSDCSVMAELAWKPAERWRIHTKYTYDVNRSDNKADMVVLNGTELSMAGGGIEFAPLKKRLTSLNLHAAAYYAWGRNANPEDIMQRHSLMVSAGVTWEMDFFSRR